MGTTLITQDLLEYANSLPAGFYSISTASGTPNAIGVSATGYILRRTGVDAIVALYGITSGTLNVNHYDGHTWLGWLKYTTNTDLQVKRYTVPKPAAGSIFTILDAWGVYAYKSGKVVIMRVNFSGYMVANNNLNVLFDLPVEYRPVTTVIINYVTQKGTPMVLEILETGEFSLSNRNAAINDDWICRQTITYVTDN